MAEHRSDAKTTKCSSIGMMSFPDVYIELVEAYPCASRDELNRREGHWIRNTPDCVNTRMAGRTINEYMREHRADPEYRKKGNEKKREYMREYAEHHREEKREYMRQYRAKKKLSAENNVLQVSGGREVQSAGEKVQGNLSE
jgi:hypothetical protein